MGPFTSKSKHLATGIPKLNFSLWKLAPLLYK